MADVKWIKITTDIFDDEKILLIESLPDAYSIIVVWFKLLCLAGKMNNSGVFVMSNKIAYTDKMLATIFRMKESTVQLALQTFEQFGMVEIIDGVITIPNWGKHQNLDQLESKKEYMRNYMTEYRARQKALLSVKPNCKANNKTNVSEADKERDKERDKELEGEKEKESVTSAAPQSDATPPVISLLLNDGSLFGVHQDKIDRWAQLYPAVDILAELRKMAGWLDANPTRRKTKAGIRRFVNGWLAKEQDRGGSAPAPTYQSKAAERNAQYCQHDAPLSPLEKKAVERALAKEDYDERP